MRIFIRRDASPADHPDLRSFRPAMPDAASEASGTLTPCPRRDVDAPAGNLSISPGARAIATLVCMIWGGNVVAVRLSLLEVPPFAAAAARSALATALILGWAVASGASLRPRISTLWPLSLLSMLTVGIVACFYLAVGRTAASHAAILVYAHPLFTAILAHLSLSDDRLSTRKTLGLLLGFTGTTLVLYTHDATSTPSSLGGDLLALLSAAIWSVYTIETKRSIPTVPLHHLALYPTLAAAVSFTFLSALLERAFTLHLSAETLLALGYQGLLATAGGNIVWFSLIARYPASSLSAYTFFTPLFGVLASAAMLDDTVPPMLFLGLCLILLGLSRLSPAGPSLPAPARRAALHNDSTSYR